MKKFIENWYLNAIVAILIVLAVAWQEISLGRGGWGIFGIGVGASVGGSLLAELIKRFADVEFSKKDLAIGVGVGSAVGVILALLAS